MRKRNQNISFRLSDDEKKIFDDLQTRTGLPKNCLIMNILSDATLAPIEYTEALKELNIATAYLTEQVKRIGINLNQLTRVANATGNVDALHKLDDIKKELIILQDRCEKLWRYTNQSIPRKR